MSEPDSIGSRIERAIGDAISATVADHERGMVLKWVAIIESLDPEGERGLWTLTSDNVKAWDTVGLLCHARDLQQARTFTAVDRDTE